LAANIIATGLAFWT